MSMCMGSVARSRGSECPSLQPAAVAGHADGEMTHAATRGAGPAAQPPIPLRSRRRRRASQSARPLPPPAQRQPSPPPHDRSLAPRRRRPSCASHGRCLTDRGTATWRAKSFKSSGRRPGSGCRWARAPGCGCLQPLSLQGRQAGRDYPASSPAPRPAGAGCLPAAGRGRGGCHAPAALFWCASWWRCRRAQRGPRPRPSSTAVSVRAALCCLLHAAPGVWLGRPLELGLAEQAHAGGGWGVGGGGDIGGPRPG